MGRKLYVGNLSDAVDETVLQDLFSSHGTVDSIKIITDRARQQTKGYGFVEMSSDREAAQAIDALHGREIEGRAINVEEAKPPRMRPAFGGGRSRRSGGRQTGHRRRY